MTPILPGATLGVVGAGQLGRMFALAARAMGYRVHVYSTHPDAPCGHVCDREHVGGYDDFHAFDRFLASVDVVSYETETIPTRLMERAAERCPVHPSPRLLQIAQHRLREKQALQEGGYPVAAYCPVASQEQLRRGLQQLGGAAILKTATGGYDGKGQWRIEAPGQVAALEQATQSLWQTATPDSPADEAPAILERVVEFDHEFSVIVARGTQGECHTYGPIRNDHARHILDVSVCPDSLEENAARQACEMARQIAEDWQVVGVFCLEYFWTPEGKILINEIAPRPHNSGHLTIEAHGTSQFEQQVRAICGLPLGSARQLRPAAMANLLGELWLQEPLDWPAALAHPDVHLHWYGKNQARAGRKMGHLTATADTAEQAVAQVLAARARLVTAG